LFEKNLFRKNSISNINLISDSEKSRRSNLILLNLQKLMKSSSIMAAGAWGCYQPLSSEPQVDFHKIIDIDWCYPKVTDKKLMYYSGAKVFSASGLNVQEPVDGKHIELHQMSGVCIPGLGFHFEGYRLGRGKGFYDLTLEHFVGPKIGLCFDFCLSSDVPYEAHDLKMDYIITDVRVLHTGEK
jgi:5-formyltetrahydrofolate cyclo-ligase